MSEVEMRALFGFDHGPKKIKRKQTFFVSDQVARELEKNRCAERVGKGSAPDPAKAAGAKSSASQAAQASPQTTAKPSGRGGKRGLSRLFNRGESTASDLDATQREPQQGEL